MAKRTNETVEDIMKKQLSILEHSDKLSKLEKESLRDKKIIQELKDREKVSARALVLFERKIKFLKESMVSELLKLCKASDDAKNIGDLQDIQKRLDEINVKLYELCNSIEKNVSISENDKAFLLNKPSKVEPKGDTQSRFDKLKADFEQKIGSSVLRKPGRPKKQDQSIVADIGLGKKVEKIVDETVETQNRLNEIFYGTPTSRKTTISTIPQSEDAMFDFAEALNPNNSLSDIMADIMSDLSSQNSVEYNKDNIDKYISRIDEDEMKELEAGYISKPNIQKTKDNNDKDLSQNKTNTHHKNGILTGNNLFEDIRK